MSPTYWGWGSANGEVAEVYGRFILSGVSANVQSIGEGSTTGSLSANGTTASFTITVTLPTARVDLSPRSLAFEALGDTKSVTVRILDTDGNEVDGATWSAFAFSSPCCTPDADNYGYSVFDFDRVEGGLEVTAEGPGSGQITISSTGVESAILRVSVYMKPATLEVSPGSPSVAVGGTATLSATIKDANGNPIHVNQGDGQGRARRVLAIERRRGGHSRGQHCRRGQQYRRHRHGLGSCCGQRHNYREMGQFRKRNGLGDGD